MKTAPLLHRSAITLFGALAVLALGFASEGRANLVVNGGLEDANAGSWTMSSTAAPGWSTTASDHQMEIWSSGLFSVPAFEGNQFMELNANLPATVYQDISGIGAGLNIDFSFAHRGRDTQESMQFTITNLGADGIFGTADDATLFSKIYTDGTNAWGIYSSTTESAILSTGDKIRVAFQSLGPGSRGNFIDGVEVTTSGEVAMTPEPSTWAALVMLMAVSFGPTVYRRFRPAPARIG